MRGDAGRLAARGLPALRSRTALRQRRARLLAAFGEALRRLLHDNFGVLVLDDWQWVDSASVELWQSLEDPGAGPTRLVAYRSAQLPPDVLRRMRRAVDAGQAVRVELAGFDADETLGLVHALSSSPGGRRFAGRLQRATDGNPFFLIETLRHLHHEGQLQIDERGRWSTPYDAATEDYAELPVPASVRDAVLARVRALGPAVQRVLEMASLIDGPLDLDMLVALCGEAPAGLLSGLDHACAARLMDAGEAGLVFAHDLVRQCLADAQRPERRRQSHTRIAAQLAVRGAPPALVALQFERAGDRAAAAPRRLRAGEAALRVHALAEALAHWQQALALDLGADERASTWLLVAGLHQRRADPAAALAATHEALAAAEAASPATSLAARLHSAELWAACDRVGEAEALLGTLTAELNGATPLQQARALELRAVMAAWQGRHDEAGRWRDAAIALLEGRPDALAPIGRLLGTAARQLLGRDDVPAAAVYARRSVAACEAATETVGLADALVLEGVCCLHGQGGAALAHQRLERARTLAARCGYVPAHRGAILNLVKIHVDAGRSAEALVLLAEGEGLAPGFEHQAAEQGFLQARYYLHYLRGELDAAGPAAERLLALARRLPNRRILYDSLQMVADLHLHSARWSQARALLDEAAQLQRDGIVLSRHAAVAAKQAWLALALGDLPAARELLATVAAVDREEDRWLVAWVSAAVALADNDLAAAVASLARVDHLQAEGPTDMLAMVLVQHLALAHRRGEAHPAARARAQALLAAGAAPALEAARLRSALAGGFNALSTPAL